MSCLPHFLPHNKPFSKNKPGYPPTRSLDRSRLVLEYGYYVLHFCYASGICLGEEMAPPRNNPKAYNTIPDVESNVDQLGVVMMMDYTVEKEAWTAEDEESPLTSAGGGDRNRNGTAVMNNKEPDTYQLSFAFSLMSGTVWFSMFLWGIWIATFYSIAIANRNWHNFNIIFPDLWTDGYPVASIAIAIHLIGAVFMSLAGAFQLVKYIRKHYAIVHRWVGRLYVISSVIASCGGLVFIFNKGSYGGREADVAFAVYGFYFLWCGICTYYYAAIAKDYSTHKLWAWRLYALSLAAWIYRADYYFWMLVFGTTVTWCDTAVGFEAHNCASSRPSRMDLAPR
jgi:uncharacterized membrane protein